MSDSPCPDLGRVYFLLFFLFFDFDAAVGVPSLLFFSPTMLPGLLKANITTGARPEQIPIHFSHF